MNRKKLTLVGASAAVSLLAASLPVSAGEIDEMRSQLQDLKDKMSQLDKMRDSKRRIAPAATVESGAKARSWKLPGTNTSMQIGGYAKLDLIYDINANKGDDLGRIQTTAPEGSAAGNRQGNFRLHARQSRIFIRTWSPTDWGELATHIEGDFEGSGGNQLISNSNSFRLRHAYGRLGPVLAGQTWTTFAALHALPETLDFGGPAGQIFVRQGQIRYTHSFGGGTLLMLSVENPEVLPIGGGPGSTSVVGTLAVTTIVVPGGAVPVAGPDGLPDFVVRLQHRWSSGMVSLAGLFRQLQVNNGMATHDTTFGWGVRFGFSHRFNDRKTTVGFQAFYGRGIARYTLAGPDAVLNGPAGPAAQLDAVEQAGGMVWIQHHWTETIRSNVAYGRNWVNVVDSMTAGVAGLPGKSGIGAIALFGGPLGQDMWTVHANLIWSPIPQVDIGVEYSFAFAGLINAANGKTHRIQASFKYAF